MRRSAASKIAIMGMLLFLTVAMPRYAFCIVIDKIVAVVNGEVITQREVTRLLIPIYEQYSKEYTGKRLESKMTEAEDTILNQLIDDKLILSEAKRQEMEASDKEVELKLQAIKDRFKTEEEFRDALVEQNISLGELRERCKNDVIKSKLVRQAMGLKVAITPSEVRQYYDNHIEEFTEPEKVRVLHILVKKDKEGRTAEEAKFLISKVKDLIASGKNFEELAKEYSEGQDIGEGEDLGLIEKDKMIEEIDAAVFSLKEGEVSDIVESPMGYHIFKVIEKFQLKYVEFENAKYGIEDLLYRSKIDSNIESWLEELRKNAYIRIK